MIKLIVLSYMDIMFLSGVFFSLLHLVDSKGLFFHFIVLDLCASMVTKGIVTESLNNIVVHIVGNLFVNHMTWKYAEKYERWKITTKVGNYFSYID